METKNSNQNVEIIRKCRLAVVQKHPYFAQGVFSARVIKSPSVGTMGVDKFWNIYYSEEFLQKLSLGEAAAVFLHEIYHPMRKHHERSKLVPNVDHEMWNICTDFEINDDIRKDGWALPETALFPEAYGQPEFQMAEWYYYNQTKEMQDLCQQLKDQKDGTGKPGNCGTGAGGQKQPWETESGGMSEAEGEMVRKAIAQAIKSCGNVSDSLLRWADEMLGEPVIDWRQELSYVLRKAADDFKAGAADYTFMRPSRRHSGGDIIFPSMYSSTPKVGCGWDTSGSIAEELKYFIAETQGILTNLGIDRVRVITGDCEVKSDVEVSNISEMRHNVFGGGGTDMGALIKHFVDSRDKIDVCIIFTDGYTPWPEEQPKFDTIIVTTNLKDNLPKWAKIIHLNMHNEKH